MFSYGTSVYLVCIFIVRKILSAKNLQNFTAVSYNAIQKDTTIYISYCINKNGGTHQLKNYLTRFFLVTYNNL